MPATLLAGTGAARASGTGTLGGKAMLRSTAAATAAGAGYPKRKPFAGAAVGEGLGFLTWPAERQTAGLQDAWFYGTGMVKRLPGSGAARATGTGTLTT